MRQTAAEDILGLLVARNRYSAGLPVVGCSFQQLAVDRMRQLQVLAAKGLQLLVDHKLQQLVAENNLELGLRMDHIFPVVQHHR